MPVIRASSPLAKKGFSKSCMHFFKDNFLILKRGFLPLLIIWIISSSVDQYLGERIEAIMRSPSGLDGSLVIFSLLSIVSGLIFPLLMTSIGILAIVSKPEVTLFDFLAKYFNQMIIEELRSWGKILLYSLFLIIPGVIKYIQLCFVQFVVTTLPEYDQGKIDALQFSKKIVNKTFLPTSGILVLFHLLLPLFMTALFDEYKIIWQTPVQSLILSGLGSYLSLMSLHLLFKVYSSNIQKALNPTLDNKGAV